MHQLKLALLQTPGGCGMEEKRGKKRKEKLVILLFFSNCIQHQGVKDFPTGTNKSNISIVKILQHIPLVSNMLLNVTAMSTHCFQNKNLEEKNASSRRCPIKSNGLHNNYKKVKCVNVKPQLCQDQYHLPVCLPRFAQERHP